MTWKTDTIAALYGGVLQQSLSTQRIYKFDGKDKLMGFVRDVEKRTGHTPVHSLIKLQAAVDNVMDSLL